MFWQFVPSQSYSTAKVLQLGTLKNFTFFSKNPSVFPEKIKFWKFWEFSIFQSQSTAKFLELGTSKNIIFFRKGQLIAWENANFQRFENSHHSSHILRQNCYRQALLDSFRVFLRETFLVRKKTLNFARFELSYCFSGILQQNCPLFGFKNFSIRSRKNHLFYQKPNTWTFWIFPPCQSHSTGILLTLDVLKTSKFFFRKTHLFFWRKRHFLNVLRILTIPVTL